MNAKKCDRKGCGKYFEPKHSIDDNLSIYYNSWGMKNVKHYDLCPECMKHIKDFLEEEKK